MGEVPEKRQHTMRRGKSVRYGIIYSHGKRKQQVQVQTLRVGGDATEKADTGRNEGRGHGHDKRERKARSAGKPSQDGFFENRVQMSTGVIATGPQKPMKGTNGLRGRGDMLSDETEGQYIMRLEQPGGVGSEAKQADQQTGAEKLGN